MIISGKKTFSWWLINYLHVEQKVNTTFLMTGGGVFHLCNALSEQREKIKSYFFYHEQQAVFAAEGISKLTNEICLVIGTSGPGATNLITGLVSCYQDSIPLIAITGQCKSNDYKLRVIFSSYKNFTAVIKSFGLKFYHFYFFRCWKKGKSLLGRLCS